MNLRELKLNRSFEKIIPPANLKRIYEFSCSRLKEKYPEDRTTYEQKRFAYILSKKTKLKFYENVWIGNRNVDIFIPGIKIDGMNYNCKGVVIEVDGGIHNNEIKIKKDKSLYEHLFKLNLLVKCVLNEDLTAHTVSSDLENILRNARTTTRERRRLWRNIYICTIYHAMDTFELKTFFGDDGASYIQKLGKIYAR